MACSFKIFNNIQIFTNSSLVKKSRESVMEFLLLNHPLDCPICDQGGECDLQDLSVFYSGDRSRFFDIKKLVDDLNLGPFIKTIMNRCIHCTKCVRFVQIETKGDSLAMLGRGKDMQIGNYTNDFFVSDFSSNVIDLCPVGALISKPVSFEFRNWDLEKFESCDVSTSNCSDIIVNIYNNNIIRVLFSTLFYKGISNFTRFFFDSLLYSRIIVPCFKINNSFRYVSWLEIFELFYYFFFQSNFKLSLGNLIDFKALYYLKNIFINTGIIDIKDCEDLIYSTNIDFISNFLLNINNLIDSLVILVGFDSSDFINFELYLKNNVKRYNRVKIFYIGSSLKKKSNMFLEQIGSSLDIFYKILEGTHSFLIKIIRSKNSFFIFGSKFLQKKRNLIMYNLLRKLNLGFYIINGFSKSSSLNLLEIFSKFYNKNIKQYKSLNLYYNTNLDNFIFKKFNICYKDLVIFYQGHHFVKNAVLSDIILPSYVFLEKNITSINISGYLKKVNSVLKNNLYFKKVGPINDKLIFQLFFKYIFDTFKWVQDFSVFRYIFEASLYFKKSFLYIYYYVNNSYYYFNYVNNYVYSLNNFNNNSFLFRNRNNSQIIFKVFSKVLKNI
jgi:NADH-quinone oxidoreductase subunit G